MYHYIILMTQQDIINKLNEPLTKWQLMNAGIVHLWLFGSYANGNARWDSDIDLLYEYDPSKQTQSSRWPYWEFEYLKMLLWKEVDLVSKKYMSIYMENILSSMVCIY
jgi:predicted nucleotidyltransferase